MIPLKFLSAFDFTGHAAQLRAAIDFCRAVGEVASGVVFCASAVNNAMPRYEKMAEGWFRTFYEKVIVRFVAFCALSWRERIPSLGWRFRFHFGHHETCPTCGAQKAVSK